MPRFRRTRDRAAIQENEGQGRDGEDEERTAPDATHAWVEALLPGLGWVGFDPTNGIMAAERHIRVAIGRDYADVPPTHGVFCGRAESTLSVAVQVTPANAPPAPDDTLAPMTWTLSRQDTGGQQ